MNQIGDEYSLFPFQLRTGELKNELADAVGKDSRLNGEVSQHIKHQLFKKRLSTGMFESPLIGSLTDCHVLK